MRDSALTASLNAGGLWLLLRSARPQLEKVGHYTLNEAADPVVSDLKRSRHLVGAGLAGDGGDTAGHQSMFEKR